MKVYMRRPSNDEPQRFRFYRDSMRSSYPQEDSADSYFREVSYNEAVEEVHRNSVRDNRRWWAASQYDVVQDEPEDHREARSSFQSYFNDNSEE